MAKRCLDLPMAVMMTDGDRLVNTTAEGAILGAMLLDNGLITELADRVSVDDFALPLHGRIMTVLLRFASAGKTATALSIRSVFKQDSDAQYGEYLDILVESPVVAEVAPALADQVADLSARRKARAAMRENIGHAAASRIRVEQVHTGADYARMVKDRYVRVMDDPDAAGMSNSLVAEFDRGLGNVERGNYSIIAGRPGMGKSSLASSLALGYAMAGHPTVFLNHEMTAEQCAMRHIADVGSAMGYELTHKMLREGRLQTDDLTALAEIEKRAALLPLRFINPGIVDVRRVRSLVAQQCAMWEAQGKELEVVFVDYLGLLRATDDDGRDIERPYNRIQKVSQSLKAIAHDYNIALFAMAQLSRAVEQRPNKRPQMADLKESGDLEQDADSVCLLYREEYYLEQEKPKPGARERDGTNAYDEWEAEYQAARNKMDLIFAKCRHNSTSTQTCKFFPEVSSVRSGEFSMFDIAEQQPMLI